MSDVSKTTINLPSDLKKELKIMAIREDTSLSGLILKMINEGYEARTKDSDEWYFKYLSLNLIYKIQIEFLQTLQ